MSTLTCCRCRRQIRPTMAEPYRDANGRAVWICRERGFMGASCARLCGMDGDPEPGAMSSLTPAGRLSAAIAEMFGRAGVVDR